MAPRSNTALGTYADGIGVSRCSACLGTIPCACPVARLRGVATEMLTALKDTLEYWETIGFADCDEGCDCVVDAVRAAISKAEAA